MRSRSRGLTANGAAHHPPAQLTLLERQHCPPFEWEDDPMTVSAALDAADRRRSPATLPGYHAGRAPR